MKIYVCATKGISLASRIIRWKQWGYPYTHLAYIGTEIDDPDNPTVIEAWWSGVEKCKLSKNHTPGTEYSIFSYDVISAEATANERFMHAQIGKSYDYRGLLGFVFYSKALDEKSRWWCSEILFAAALKTSVCLFRDTDPAEVDPRLFLKSPRLIHEGDYKL